MQVRLIIQKPLRLEFCTNRACPRNETAAVRRLPIQLWRHSALDLRSLPSAVPSARLHARHVLLEWGLAVLAEAGELVVSELVTNARKASLEVATIAGPPPVRLRLTERAHNVQIEVWDADDRMPQSRRDKPLDAEGGWGLVLVDALSTRWGAYATVGGGKTVWAMLAK